MSDQMRMDEDEQDARQRPATASTGVAPRRLAAFIGEAFAVIFGYTAVVAMFMWPVARDPIHLATQMKGFGHRADQNLVAWILAWDWHALTTDPFSLFDANIHHPALNTLAGAEHMLGVVPLSSPMYAISGNPFFAVTVTHILTLGLCGASMYALLRHWGVVRAGALFGGFVYALYPGQIQSSAQLQLYSRQYLPLVLIFLDETLQNARIRSAVAMAFLLVWQMLCSVYLAFIAAIGLAAYSGAVLAKQWRRLRWPGIGLVVAAAIVAALVLVPIHVPYLELRSSGRIADYTDTGMLVAFSSGPWRNWVVPPGIARVWEVRAHTGVLSYLGLFPVLAAGCVLVFRRREKASWAAPAAFAMLLAGYSFALGPWGNLLGHTFTLPYGHVAEWVPGFSSMRAPTRFSIGAMTGLAALAGIGLGRALQALEAWRHGRLLAVGALALMLVATAVEYDLPFDPPDAVERPVGDGVPRVYRQLAEMPRGPLLEIPWNGRLGWRMAALSSEYMYFSTYHWNPLLNGYTGHPPPSALITGALVRALPDPHAVEILARATGLKYVLVHLAKVPVPFRAQWAPNPAGLELVARFGQDLLFEVVGPIEPDLLETMQRGPTPGHTLLGTPIAPIPEATRVAAMRFTVAPRTHAHANTNLPVEVEIHNPSTATWPSLASGTANLVGLDYRLIAEDGEPAPINRGHTQLTGSLPYDLLPGERVRVESWVTMPDEPGIYTLEVWLEQNDQRFDGSLLRSEIRIEAASRSVSPGAERGSGRARPDAHPRHDGKQNRRQG